MAKRRTKKDETLRAGAITARPLCGWITRSIPCSAPGTVGPFPTYADKYHDKPWFVSPCAKHWKAIAEKREEVFASVGFQTASHELIEEFRLWITKHFGPQTFAPLEAEDG